jgi:hypothetical protein
MLMVQVTNSESIPESVKRIVSQLDALTPVIPIIQKGQRSGEIKDGDPVALAVAFWGAIQGVAEFLAVNPELPIPKSSWIVDILRPVG